VLLDVAPQVEKVRREMREVIEPAGDRTTDLHVWQLGPGHFAAIISLVARNPRAPFHYKAQLAHIAELSHITVGIQRQAV
jgi:Co/Zn/Cd efflux system component